MSNPTSSGAPTVPPMSADDARFYALKAHDDANALTAWQTVEPLVRAMTETPRSLPKVDLDYALLEVIRLAPTFAKYRAPTLARLSAAQAAEAAQAVDALPRLAFATRHVMRLEAMQSADGPSLATLNAEGVALRERGLSWCVILERFDHLPAGTTEAIRRGRPSYGETATDLNDLFIALSPHRALIAQLGAVVGAPLTEADLDRMLRVSALITERVAEDTSPLGWRVALLRLSNHLATAYDIAHACVRLHLTLSKDPTRLPSFFSLRRPVPAQKPAANPAPNPTPDQAPPSP